VKRLVRLALVVALAVWAWRFAVGIRRPASRVAVSFTDGSALELPMATPEFDVLANEARAALAR
jgi:hypothetical protein